MGRPGSGGPAKVMWTGTAGPPYSFVVWGDVLQKTNLDSLRMEPSSRRVVLSSRSGRGLLSVEIENPLLENASDSVLAFVPLNDSSRYDAENIWNLMESADYLVPQE